MKNYSSVTEVSGNEVTREQIQRMCARYRFALDFSKDRSVLEVACGSGQGLGYLARHARRVVGMDIDHDLVKLAHRHYAGRSTISVLKADAHTLPFGDGTFDVIILYEALYYLSRPQQFLREAHRVLAANGVVLVCSANKELWDFNPSPLSHRYFAASELYDVLRSSGFSDISLFGDCPVDTASVRSRILSGAKRAAVKLRLVPKTMEGKKLLKRIVFGRLIPMPPEIGDCDGEGASLSPLAPGEHDRKHKVIFSVAYKRP